MKITVKTSLSKSGGQALIMPFIEKEKVSGQLKAFDKKLSGEITALFKRKEFEGKSCQTAGISTLKRLPASRIVLVGLGKKKDLTIERIRRAAGIAGLYCKNSALKSIAFDLNSLGSEKFSLQEKAQAALEGMFLSNYEYLEFKGKEKKKAKKIESITLLTDAKNKKAVEKTAKETEALCNAVYTARDLINMPPNKKTPKFMANFAKKVAKKNKLKIKVFDEKQKISCQF